MAPGGAEEEPPSGPLLLMSRILRGGHSKQLFLGFKRRPFDRLRERPCDARAFERAEYGGHGV